MNLREQIESVVFPYLRDRDIEPGLSPCVLKQILQELALYVYQSGSVHELILDVLNSHSAANLAESRVLSAPPQVQWLVTRYTSGPYCNETYIERMAREAKIEILRGGLRSVGKLAALQGFGADRYVS